MEAEIDGQLEFHGSDSLSSIYSCNTCTAHEQQWGRLSWKSREGEGPGVHECEGGFQMRVCLMWSEERWIMSDVKRYVNALGNKKY